MISKNQHLKTIGNFSEKISCNYTFIRLESIDLYLIYYNLVHKKINKIISKITRIDVWSLIYESGIEEIAAYIEYPWWADDESSFINNYRVLIITHKQP